MALPFSGHHQFINVTPLSTSMTVNSKLSEVFDNLWIPLFTAPTTSPHSTYTVYNKIPRLLCIITLIGEGGCAALGHAGCRRADCVRPAGRPAGVNHISLGRGNNDEGRTRGSSLISCVIFKPLSALLRKKPNQ